MTEIMVGTEKGGYRLARSGKEWTVEGPLFPGWKVTAFGWAPDGSHLLAVGSNWFGVGIHRGSGQGPWEQTESPPAWPESTERKMEQVWTFHGDGERVWAGVAEAGLFTSEDHGVTWDPVEGLNEHRTRPDWYPGFGGLCAHRVLTVGERQWVGISAVGVFRSDDGGSTWEPKNDGVDPASTPEDAPRPEVGYCVHGLAQDPDNPDRIWRQDHTGVYRTTDGANSWERIESGLPAGFGFVMWRDRESGRLFVVPMEADSNRVPVGGKLRAYRSDDHGNSWEVAGTGWTKAPQFTGVLRNAVDGDHRGVVCLGTTGGKVWLTGDNGERWEELPPAFPRILAVQVLS